MQYTLENTYLPTATPEKRFYKRIWRFKTPKITQEIFDSRVKEIRASEEDIWQLLATHFPWSEFPMDAASLSPPIGRQGAAQLWLTCFGGTSNKHINKASETHSLKHLFLCINGFFYAFLSPGVERGLTTPHEPHLAHSLLTLKGTTVFFLHQKDINAIDTFPCINIQGEEE